MKLTVEIDPGAAEEIIIRAKEVTPRIKRLQDAISRELSGAEELAVKSGDTECFLPFSRLLFAECSEDKVWVHTASDVYLCPLRLRELEEMLPRTFARASKSVIVNTAHVRSLSRSPTGVGEAGFSGCEKKVFISRMYYKSLRDVIERTRLAK